MEKESEPALICGTEPTKSARVEQALRAGWAP